MVFIAELVKTSSSLKQFVSATRGRAMRSTQGCEATCDINIYFLKKIHKSPTEFWAKVQK